MRVTRFLMLFLAVAIVVAGCASQPVAYVAMAPNGMDSAVYGWLARLASGYGSGYGYAPGYGYATGSIPGYGYGPGIQGPYTLDSGDRLRIVVFGQDGLTNSYAVNAGGHIAMPLRGAP